MPGKSSLKLSWRPGHRRQPLPPLGAGFNHRDRSRLPDVVAVRLERQAQDPDRLPGDIHMLLQEVDQSSRAGPRSVPSCVQDQGLDAERPGMGDERPDVLREAGSAEPDPGSEELVADPRVHSHPVKTS